MKNRNETKGELIGAPETPIGTFGNNDLTYYLVSRFIVVLLCVVAAEMVVMWVEGAVLLPFLAPMVLDAASQAVGNITSVADLIRWLLAMLAAMVDVGHMHALGMVARSFGILLLLAMLFLLMIPVLAGALVFAYLVVRKVRALQARREDELRQQERQRNQFITDVAHDLRTPLMAISGMSHAMADGLVRTDAMREEYLRSICEKADKMGDLVTSVFDYTKLGSAGYNLQIEAVNLPELLLREAAVAYTDAEDFGQELTVHVPEEHCVVQADPVQLARVVANFLSNAIRHNEPGIEVALMMVRQAGVAYVVVADTGAPITDNPEDLFQPFTRGDASRSAKGGSGLGLSICKRVADMHGFGISLVQPYGRFPKAFVLQCPVE
ncbi:MAG: HAMP domain-containing histidine kinase [Eggerthellaceae bacterium]|nr:HAMP domain-containing histidine kinase [Eggerthellaceae bacterium]